ncbi:unnamed protein product, partial [marine sediment metagenome]
NNHATKGDIYEKNYSGSIDGGAFDVGIVGGLRRRCGKGVRESGYSRIQFQRFYPR